MIFISTYYPSLLVLFKAKPRLDLALMSYEDVCANST